MSVGASIGMNFINKGIDQFTFGVGQEYNRYAREKSRKWQVQNMQSALQWRVKDGAKVGLHPLASIGANTNSGGIISPSTPSPPSGGGNPIHSKPNDTEKRLIEANARKTEAEAGILEKELLGKTGQPDGINLGSGLAPNGQTDGNIYPAQTGGVEHQSGAIHRYGEAQDGTIYTVPTQSYEQAFSDEGTIINRALYNINDVKFKNDIRRLRHDWSNPSFANTKNQFLITRPKLQGEDKKRYVVLWNGVNWKKVLKNSKNKDYLFTDGYPTMKPQRKKRRVHENYEYSPVS